jgi:hypothetical protein
MLIQIHLEVVSFCRGLWNTLWRSESISNIRFLRQAPDVSVLDTNPTWRFYMLRNSFSLISRWLPFLGYIDHIECYEV